MDAQRKTDLAAELNDMGRRFWAGEAEICRQFWGVSRTNEEQAHHLSRLTKPASPSLYQTSPSMNSSRKFFRRSASAGSALRLPSSALLKTRT